MASKQRGRRYIFNGDMLFNILCVFVLFILVVIGSILRHLCQRNVTVIVSIGYNSLCLQDDSRQVYKLTSGIRIILVDRPELFAALALRPIIFSISPFPKCIIIANFCTAVPVSRAEYWGA